MEVAGIILAVILFVASITVAIVMYAYPLQLWFAGPALSVTLGRHTDWMHELWADIKNEGIKTELLKKLNVPRLEANVHITVSAARINDDDDDGKIIGPLPLNDHTIIKGGSLCRFILASKHNAEKNTDYPAFLGHIDPEEGKESPRLFMSEGEYFMYIEISLIEYGKTTWTTQRFEVKHNALRWIDETGDVPWTLKIL